MKKIKSGVVPFLSGITILAIMFVTMKWVTIDFRIVLLLSSTLIFLAAYISGNKKLPKLVIILLVILPFTLVFDLLIYSEIPKLIWFTVFFMLAAITGVILKKKLSKKRISLTILFSALLLLMSFLIVPNMLEEQLSEVKNLKSDSYTIYDMDRNKISSKDLKGKIVVLDFFGTWCKPCRLELKELQKIYNHFDGSDEIEFFVINTNEGGDTKEKMNQYILDNNYPFKFGFDYDGELVKQFDLYGVPYLFIFDKKGNMRYEHIGYNKGESNFISSIVEIIESLK